MVLGSCGQICKFKVRRLTERKKMLSSGNNLSRGNAGLSSDMPPLPQYLPLELITLGNQKYTRSGELSRVLGVPLRSSTSEDHSFGVSYPKPSPPVATEELKNFKESVQDASRKARYGLFYVLQPANNAKFWYVLYFMEHDILYELV